MLCARDWVTFSYQYGKYQIPTRPLIGSNEISYKNTKDKRNFTGGHKHMPFLKAKIHRKGIS